MRLTADEIRLVAFLLSALLLGTTVKACRNQQRMAQRPLPPAPTASEKDMSKYPARTGPQLDDENGPRP